MWEVGSIVRDKRGYEIRAEWVMQTRTRAHTAQTVQRLEEKRRCPCWDHADTISFKDKVVHTVGFFFFFFNNLRDFNNSTVFAFHSKQEATPCCAASEFGATGGFMQRLNVTSEKETDKKLKQRKSSF